MTLARSLCLAGLLLGAGSPAIAAAPKEKIVVMPASVLAKPDSRICMPRSTSLTAGKDKTLPATLCLTVAEWESHGVRFTAK